MFLLLLLALSNPVFSADSVKRIEAGKDFKEYSNADLQKRVWDLEKAVEQLQEKVFELEAKPSKVVEGKKWFCKSRVMGFSYTASGNTRDEAAKATLEVCQKARRGDGLICSDPQCYQ